MLTGAIVFLVMGFLVLIYSADCLVRGALAAAYKSNVSPLLVGPVLFVPLLKMRKASTPPMACAGAMNVVTGMVEV